MTDRRTGADGIVSRRRLIQLAGAGAAGAALGITGLAPTGRSNSEPVVLAQEDVDDFAWDEEFDIVIAGSGGASAAAAVTAAEHGASVVMFEKSDEFGGTTGHSGGGSFVPNNEKMQEAGIDDNLENTIRYICRVAFPQYFDPGAANYGLPEIHYAPIETFVQRAADVFAWFEEIEALRTVMDPDYPLYNAGIPEAEGVPLSGQLLFPLDDDGVQGGGGEMMIQFRRAMEERDVDIRMEHPVERLVQNEEGEVIGVVARDPEGEEQFIGAHHGVFFGTGGFANNPEMNHAYLRGPVFGGGAPASNQGDFVYIAGSVGAAFANMQHAWLAEAVLDQAVELPGRVPTIVQPPGDSMIYVNRFGHRVVDEKMQYQDRPHAHFNWDPVRAEYTNLVLFMIYDNRTATEFAGSFPIPADSGDLTYVVTGETLEELAGNIGVKLEDFVAHTGNVHLDEDFVANLRGTIGAYNQFAEDGSDRHFHRGETPIEIHNHAMFSAFAQGDTDHDYPNPTMHPIADEGPYYCVLIVASSFDTKGGALTDIHGRVIDRTGEPVPGLYAAGNCTAAPVGQAYPGPGATLGPALTFGYLAGVALTEGIEPTDDPEPDDDDDDDEDEPDEDDDQDEPDEDDDQDDDPDDDDEDREATEHVVEILENPFVFDPEHLTIRAGDSIRWINQGTMAHTATGDPERAFDPENGQLPDGAEPWHSGSLAPGEEYVHTFDVPGEYTYFCVPHEVAGQVGSFTVE